MARVRADSSVVRGGHRVLFAFMLVHCVIASAGSAAAEVAERLPRVLILYPYDERIPGINLVGETARMRLQEATAGKIELFSEFLDMSRFREKVHIDRMGRYLAEKYSERRPDAVMALGEESIRFMVAHRDEIAPEARIVYAGITGPHASELKLPSNAVGALTQFDIRKTFEMARELQPASRQLYILAGSADFDQSWLATARQDLAEFAESYHTTYLTGLSIDEFAEHASRLPSDAILLVLTVLRSWSKDWRRSPTSWAMPSRRASHGPLGAGADQRRPDSRSGGSRRKPASHSWRWSGAARASPKDNSRSRRAVISFPVGECVCCLFCPPLCNGGTE